MKNELQTIGNDRLKAVLVQDKKDNPMKIVNVLKSEILCVLKDYMDLSAEEMVFDIGIDNDGKYVLTLNAKISHLYVANYLV